MGDNISDEVLSPDIGRPRYLFRRYDSASGSSDSCRSSIGSSSRGSYLQSPRRQNDQQTRCTRTISGPCTETISCTYESSLNGRDGKGRERSNGITTNDFGSPDVEDTCMFCDTLVYERQYYLWHSQYTKSSLCTRCSQDNDGMRYISYWGTPSYETGSWRKRYRAGRSTDIDLSPLLEVLERIDRIDTSIGGRTSAKYKNVNECHDNNNNITIPLPDLECFEIKESDEMDARRRRRVENRKVIENSSKLNYSFAMNQKLNFSIVRQGTSSDVRYKEASESNTPVRGDGKHDHVANNKDTNEKDREYTISEMSDNSEEVDVIEPLNIINVTENILTDNGVKGYCKGTENFNTVNQGKTLETRNREDTLSAEKIANYRKQRRKSNYEEFLAGLEPVSQFTRRSTAAGDLTNYRSGKKGDVNAHKITINSEGKSKSVINDVTAAAKGTEYTAAAPKGTYSSFYHDDGCVVGLKNKDTERQNGDTEHKNNKVRRKFKLKRKKTSYPCDTNEAVKSTSPSVTDAKATYSPSLNRRRKSRTILRVSDTCADNCSSDETNCAEVAFSDIKRRFENFSKGTTFQNGRPMIHKRQTDVSKGNFRSRYIKMAEGGNDFYSEDDCENCDGVSSYSLNKDEKSVPKRIQNCIEEKLKRESGTFETTDMSQYHVTDDSDNQSEDIGNVKDIPTVTAERTNRLIIGNDSNEMADNEPRLAEYNENGGSEFFRHSEICKRKASVSSPSTKLNVEEKTRLFNEVPVTIEDKSNLGKFQCSESTSDSNDYVSDGPRFKESLSNSNNEVEDRSPTELVLNDNMGFDEHRNRPESLKGKEHNKQGLNARAREQKYKQYGDTEHENPNIERIKKKLSRKPKYEDDDSNSEELNDTILVLNGSDDEEVELGWRTRGYNTDFYMSRRSVTGGEILDRYKRAISNRRSKRNSRVNSRRSSKSSAVSSTVAKLMIHSDPVSRCGLRQEKSSSASAPITRSSTQSKLSINGNENGECSGYRLRDTNCTGGQSGVSAAALKAALDRATSCSERMSQRIKSQLQQSDSCGSSS